jgi:hypothetical protein
MMFILCKVHDITGLALFGSVAYILLCHMNFYRLLQIFWG